MSCRSWTPWITSNTTSFGITASDGNDVQAPGIGLDFYSGNTHAYGFGIFIVDLFEDIFGTIGFRTTAGPVSSHFL